MTTAETLFKLRNMVTSSFVNTVTIGTKFVRCIVSRQKRNGLNYILSLNLRDTNSVGHSHFNPTSVVICS